VKPDQKVLSENKINKSLEEVRDDLV